MHNRDSLNVSLHYVCYTCVHVVYVCTRIQVTGFVKRVVWMCVHARVHVCVHTGFHAGASA